MSTDAAPDPKREAAAAIARAQADLEHAVHELERLPSLDVNAIALAAQALTSFLTVTGVVVDLLIPLGRTHPDRQVGVWLDGLAHATALMSHTVSQLMNSSVNVPTTLRIEDVEVVRLVERACAYYRRTAEQKAVLVHLRVAADVPEIRTDRVLLAAIVDSLLSNAIMHARPRTSVAVDVRAERGGMTCRVRDEGPALSTEESARVFVPAAQAFPPTGYGLAVAKRFVDQLGGQIAFESVPDDGTTTSVWLPRARSIA
jgi:signal transduction histidine kinase